jgi:hypothetical protein
VAPRRAAMRCGRRQPNASAGLMRNISTQIQRAPAPPLTRSPAGVLTEGAP